MSAVEAAQARQVKQSAPDGYARFRHLHDHGGLESSAPGRAL
jgi:hypothetical protein